jgi:membrane fusion protein
MDWSGRDGDREELPPFLEADLPHWAARGLPFLLILLFSAMAAGSALVHVPEVVSSPFVLMPVDGSDPVRAPRSGIVAELKVREGDEVADGQSILIFASREAGDRSAELGSLERQLQGAAEARDNAQRKRQQERRVEGEEERALRERATDLTRMLSLAREQLALKEEVVARRERLYEEGLTSWEEVIGHQLEVKRLALEVGRLEAEGAAIGAALAKLIHEVGAREAEFRELERRLTEGADRNAIRAAALRHQLVDSVGGAVAVSAPCSGSILRLLVKSRGAVVQEGELLGEVSCHGGRLEAELAVSQGGIGRIRVAQPVKLLYDTFPYQRFGVRHGHVRWIGPASVRTGDDTVFRVLVEPRDDSFMIDGRQRALMPGMRGEARIVVGRRSILSYAVAPLRQLRESLATPVETLETR